MKAAGQIWSRLNTLCEALSGCCLILITAFTLYEIVSRYVFDSPTLWAQDFAVYLMIWCAFLGVMPTDRAGQHIRIDIWYRRLSPRSQATLESCCYWLICVFALITAWAGAEIAAQSLRLGRRSLSLVSVPMWLPQAAVACGMGLFAVECARRALQAALSAWRPVP